MAANIYMRSFSLGLPEWKPLAETTTIVDATIVVSTKNLNPISLRTVGGITTSWPPGAMVSLPCVDLSQIEIKGSNGHVALVVGTTPRARRQA